MSSTSERINLPVEELTPKAIECANKLLSAEKVLVASHIDADGLTSAGIAAIMLQRSRIKHESTFYKQLDQEKIEQIALSDYDTVLFTDFGSGQLDIISEYEAEGHITPIISDHHEPADAETRYHLNPILYGIDGSSELSGAGTTYILARCLSEIHTDQDSSIEYECNNKDLASLALVGAVGDMQGGTNGIHGANREIVDEGIEAGVIDEKEDISFYGKQTRPVPKMLEYSDDVRIPGITGSESGAIEFLHEVNVDLTDDSGDWKHWTDLTRKEKQKVVSGLIQKAIDSGVPSSRVDQIVGPTYELTDEEEKTALRDVSEFSTLLNSTARYERQEIGLAVCLGDREEAYDEALTLLKNHQKNISQGIEWVVEEGVTNEENLQWFDAGDKIRETIVGIIAGMSLGSTGISKDTPIIAFAEKETEDSEADEADTNTNELKVSSRTTRTQTRNGVDLSVVMEKASQHVGGDGGGHNIAAGATIPQNKRSKFIAKADDILTNQINS